ncbi:MAG: hypothetical protein J6B63_04715 [Treponema sp.]|nr:hypothetical protein [Treponema sp.]
MNLKETEHKIRQYYKSFKILKGLRQKLEVYKNRKADLENKINNSNIKLNDNFSAINYDNVGGGIGSVAISPQDRAIEKAFLILEKQLEDVNAEILLIEEQIFNIEMENNNIEFILKGMKSEYINILEFLFKYEKTTLQTSMNCNMDKSTVSRKKDKVIREVMKWLNFYN